jgi:hypothetical protein
MPGVKKIKKISHHPYPQSSRSFEDRAGRRGQLKQQEVPEEEVAENFHEVLSKEREQTLGDRKPEDISPRDKTRIKMLWIITALIMVVVIVLWILNLKNNFSDKANGANSNSGDLSAIWQEMKQNIDKFSNNINDLFSKLDQEKLNAANQGIPLNNLNQDDLKKLTNEILQKLEEKEKNANSNANANLNVQSANSNINSNTNTK